MNRVRQNQNGFSAVEIIIVSVILAVVGLAGWMVYRHQNKAKPASTPAASTNASSTASTGQNGMYSGWQSYCDTINNGCFKYPANWTLASSNANGLVSVKVTSPGQTATAEYKSYIAGIGNPPQSGAAFYAASTNSLATANSSLQVVGGYFTSSTIPYYYLVDASALTSFPLTAGQTSQFEAIPSYSLNGSDNYGGFYASNTGTGAAGTAAQAQAWYSTSDGATALQIIQSFTYQ